MLIKPPCNKKCIRRGLWTDEMPFIIDTEHSRRQITTMFICMSCIHFVKADNFFYGEEEWPRE